MGVKGRRNIETSDEPNLLGNIDEIIKAAKQNGFISSGEVDIKKIIQSNGIEIREEVLASSVSGYLVKENGKWIIGVNKNHHIRRQRFTLAHEFAHYNLHRTDLDYFEDEIFYRNEVRTSVEYAANAYASQLLMPEDLLKKAILNEGLTTLKDLAELFNVSTLAVKNRVVTMGYKIKDDEK
jgi:Zn-dependent peptidase ImmA (M78 family)